MSEKLKPCPFCGGGAATYQDDGFWVVGCNDDAEDGCLASLTWGQFAREADAIAAWNVRASTDELAAVLHDIVGLLRKEAPGTPLNNHRFDALGARANAALTKFGSEQAALPIVDRDAGQALDALEPFYRAAAIQPPGSGDWPDDKPNADFLPTAWPDWGDFKRARDIYAGVRGESK